MQETYCVGEWKIQFPDGSIRILQVHTGEWSGPRWVWIMCYGFQVQSFFSDLGKPNEGVRQGAPPHHRREAHIASDHQLIIGLHLKSNAVTVTVSCVDPLKVPNLMGKFYFCYSHIDTILQLERKKEWYW